MRNLIITTIFILISNFIFGQKFARATHYQLGTIDTLTQVVNWDEKVKMEPTLVSIGSRNLKIHTEKFQQYFFEGPKYELYEVKGYYYESYTAEGKECVIYVYIEEDGSNYLEIEHQNYIIKYSLTDL
jgi:hypothetical protein